MDLHLWHNMRLEAFLDLDPEQKRVDVAGDCRCGGRVAGARRGRRKRDGLRESRAGASGRAAGWVRGFSRRQPADGQNRRGAQRRLSARCFIRRVDGDVARSVRRPGGSAHPQFAVDDPLSRSDTPIS